MRWVPPTGIAVVALLGVLLFGAAGAGGAPAAVAGHSIVVSGSGSVASVPDRAQVSFGVSSTAKTASGALRANAAEMTKVIAAVKSQGIPAADIRTEFVSLSPVYSQNGNEIVGYNASNSVGATIRNLDKIGALIDAAVDAGANQINGPNLVRSDANALYRQALRAAIANARGKAQAIARASGLRLRRITDVSESGGPTPVPEAAKATVAPSTPIEPGTQLVEATVTVTFSVA
jgi:uncharacterized protein YggE